MEKRELHLNDTAAVMYQSSILNSLAIWGSKDFPKKPPKFRLKPLTEKELEEQLLNQIMMFGASLTAEALRGTEDDKDNQESDIKKLAKEIGAIDADEVGIDE